MSSDKDEALIYLYGDSVYGPCNGGTRVCFMHHKISMTQQKQTWGFGRHQDDMKPFGPPLFLWIPDTYISNQSCTDDLYSTQNDF